MEKANWVGEKGLNLINAEKSAKCGCWILIRKKREMPGFFILFTVCMRMSLSEIGSTEGMVSRDELHSKLSLSNEKVYLDKSNGLRSEPLKHFYGSDGR